MIKPKIPKNETLRLSALHKLGILDTDDEERFDRITRIVKKHFQASIVLVSLVDEQRQWFKSRQCLETTETHRDVSFCAHAILSEEVLLVPDALEDKRFFDNPLVTGSPSIRFYAGAPLHSPSGELIGTLCVIDESPRDFNDDDLEMLREFANLVETEIARTRLLQVDRQLRDFKATLDVTHDCVFMFDPESLRFFYVNQGALDQLGYSFDELVGMTPVDIKPEFDEESFRSFIKPLTEGENNSTFFETVHLTKSGLSVPVSIFLQFVDVKPGKSRFVAIVRDIAEEMQIRNDLQESETRNRAIVDTVVDGIVTIDEQGIIENFNPAAEKIFGFSAEEIINKNVNILMPEPYRSQHDNYLFNYRDSGEAKVIGIGRQVLGLRKDGSEFPMDLAVNEMWFGETRMFTGIVRDITAQKKAELALFNYTENLELINEIALTGGDAAQRIISALARALGLLKLDVGIISFIQEDKYTIKYHVGQTDQPIYDGLVFELGDSFCSRIVNTNDVVAVSGNNEEDLDRLTAYQEARAKSYIGAPVYVDGKLFGTVSFSSLQPHYRDFNESDKIFIDLLSRWLGSVIELDQAYEQSRLNEKRLKLSQRFASIGTWDWNVQTGDLYWSDRIAPLFGYPDGELETTYDNFLKAIHPDDRQDVIDAVKNCVENNAEYNIEHRVVWPDGQIRWLHEKGDVVRDRFGTPLHMLGVVFDIHDRKLAQQALFESERQLREAQSIAHIGSWQASLVTGSLVWSDEIYRIFGFEPGSFEPSIERFYEAVHADDLDKVKASEQQSKITGYHNVIHRIVLPTGEVRHVHEIGKVEKNKNGDVIGLNGTVQDITDEVIVKEELTRARDEAQRANSAKSEFLSSMSHELRTPLNAILGLSQLFKLDKTLSQQQRKNVEEILNSGNHLLSLINDILDLAKIESGHFELNIEPVDVTEVLNECASVILPLANERGITVRLETENHHCLSVSADKIRLKQILLNLLSNAVKYNDENGFIDISCNIHTDKVIRISVRDTGQGIPEEQIDRLFQPFSRLQWEFSVTEGTGIGLVIARQLAEHMSSCVYVESTPGEGSVFWMDLPFAEVSDKETDVWNEDAPESLSFADIDFQGEVLVAEDNKANQAVLQQQFEVLGIEADIVDNGQLALNRWREGQYRLILTDLQMPVMDGYQLVQEIRAEEACSGAYIPVVAITANAMKEDRERCLEMGMDGFITKPVMLDALSELLGQWLSVNKEDTDKTEISTATRSTTDPVNLDVLSSLVGDDTQKHCVLMNIFVDQTPEIIASIEHAHDLQNAEDIYKGAHKLKSSARALGASELTKTCEELEDAGRNKEWQVIKLNVPKLPGLFLEIKAYVDKHCRKTVVQPASKTDSVFSELKLLIVDDDRVIADLEKIMLEKMGVGHVDTALSAHQAFDLIEYSKSGYDILLCDLNMPQMDGIEFLRHLAKDGFKGVIILISGVAEKILRSAEKLAQEHCLNVIGTMTKPAKMEALNQIFIKYLDNQAEYVNEKLEINKERIKSSQLISAIHNRELVNYYQPKVNVSDGRIAGVETLVRWQHPDRGLILPDQFIGLAEKERLIDSLTKVVFQQAVSDMAILKSEGIELNCAINMSVNTLYDLDWPDFAKTVVSNAGVEPSTVTLEVTESRLIENLKTALEVLTRMSMNQFNLSIDDFGTGYSSMEQLQRAPFSELKIDRSFVNNAIVDSSLKAILESSVQLGKKLDMQVVAEGVENQDDWDLVKTLGCDEVQGYFIAKPMPFNELRQWLQVR